MTKEQHAQVLMAYVSRMGLDELTDLLYLQQRAIHAAKHWGEVSKAAAITEQRDKALEAVNAIDPFELDLIERIIGL